MPKKVIFLHIVLIISVVTFIVGCQDNPNIKDLSDIHLEMKVTRFESELFTCKNVEDIRKLKSKFPDFYSTYVNSIVASNVQTLGGSDEDIVVNLYKYIAHHQMDSLYTITQNKFGDFEQERKELEKAAKYINYYFPKDKIENVTTFISTFQYGSAYNSVGKEFLVGLDLYLGADFEVYTMIDPQHFPTYRVKKFEPYRVVPNCVQTYVNYKIPEVNSSTFIEQAVHEGKKLYVLDLLLPESHDSLKINYLKGQIEWAIDQESNIWSYLIEKNVLFNSDKNEYQKHYFNDGPFTTPFGNESAPRTGAWVGWQIVKAYMTKNSEVTIDELIANKDYQNIFQKSGYRP
ncbi:MAG: hypothetical protein COA58_16035 [Bacteroidetes bacterium]|nr:MAG: hypothetical protein COA58_16035 [Bacteroidota bacterium]